MTIHRALKVRQTKSTKRFLFASNLERLTDGTKTVRSAHTRLFARAAASKPGFADTIDTFRTVRIGAREALATSAEDVSRDERVGQ